MQLLNKFFNLIPDFFPFAWIDLKRSYFSNDIFQTGELLTFGEPLTASEGSICRASIASEQKLIGTVHKTDFPHCQVYSNGQLIERADFELLLNQRKVAVTWIDVPNFNEIPNSALLASWSFWLLEPSTKIGVRFPNRNLFFTICNFPLFCNGLSP